MTHTAAQLLPTAIQALTTPILERPPSPGSRQKSADWLGLQTLGDPQLEKMVDGCWQWATAFRKQESPRWLSLIGNSGTGKTHCARKLWNWGRPQMKWDKCSYIPGVIYWPDFIQQLRTGDSFPYRNDMKRWPVLLLDDIGSERDPSGFAAEELNTLLGCRMDKWTIITSNLDIATLRKVDARIASRMIRGRNICIGVNTVDFSER